MMQDKSYQSGQFCSLSNTNDLYLVSCYNNSNFNFDVCFFRVLPLHDSSQILAVKLAAYNQEIATVKEWYEKEHMNTLKISGERSKWWVWNATLEAARSSVVQIQTYLQRISDGKSARINDMCITPTEFLQRVGDYNQYCPVSLALRGELVDCSTNPTLEFSAEFRG